MPLTQGDERYAWRAPDVLTAEVHKKKKAAGELRPLFTTTSAATTSSRIVAAVTPTDEDGGMPADVFAAQDHLYARPQSGTAPRRALEGNAQDQAARFFKNVKR